MIDSFKATNLSTEDPMTDKQLDYINALLLKCVQNGNGADRAVVGASSLIGTPMMNKRSASEMITMLKPIAYGSPKPAKPMAASTETEPEPKTDWKSSPHFIVTPAESPKNYTFTKVTPGAPVSLLDVLEQGIYDLQPDVNTSVVDGIISGKYAIVTMMKNGKFSVKKIYTSYSTKSGYSALKYNTYSMAHMISSGKAVKITKEEAGKLGKKIGVCLFCLHTLSDSLSIAYGYGPVCAKTWGLPHH